MILCTVFIGRVFTEIDCLGGCRGFDYSYSYLATSIYMNESIDERDICFVLVCEHLKGL